jgi:hypothetical protein
VEKGLESRETVDAWREMFKYYVPLNRADTDYSVKNPGSSGAGYNVRSSTVKSRTGSTTEVIHSDILAHIAENREIAIIRAKKAPVSRAVFGAALKFPNPKFWLAIDPSTNDLRKSRETEYLISLYREVVRDMDPAVYEFEIKEYKREIARLEKLLAKQNAKWSEASDALLKDIQTLGLTKADLDSMMEPPMKPRYDKRTKQVVFDPKPAFDNKFTLATRMNGNDRFVIFNGNDPQARHMVEALKSMDVDALGPIMSTLATMTRYFASINTQFNPVFGPYNFLRDVQTAMLQLSTTPIANKKSAVIKRVMSGKPLAAIYKAARAETKGKAYTASTEAEKAWEEMKQGGGTVGFREQFSDTEDRAESLRRMIDPSSWADTPMGKVFTINGKLKVPMEQARKIAKPVFDWLSDYNTTLENAVRLAVYIEGRDHYLQKGDSQKSAQMKAAALAKDITVNFNRKGQIANQAGALYAFFNASVQGTNKMIQTYRGPVGKTIIGGSLLLGSLQAFMLAMAGFDSDEPKEYFKQRNYIIPIGNKEYISFPMPLGFNFLPSLSRIATEVMMDIGEGKNPQIGKRITDAAGLLFDMFNPIGNSGISFQTLAPTVADPLVALGENRDWRRLPIAREDIDSKDPTPGFTRYKENASFFSKQLAEFINSATGGTKDTPGILSPTPDQLDYLTGQLTGGVGREILKTSKLVESTFTGEEIESYNIPLLGRFYGDARSTANVSNRFYENITKLNTLDRRAKGLASRGEDVNKFVQENPQVRLSQLADRIDKDVSRMRKLRREMVERGEPKERIRDIESRINERMQMLNDRVAEMERR